MAGSKTGRKGLKQPVVTSDVARDQLGELLSRVRFGGERIVLTRHGQRIAALVGIEDFDKLEQDAA